MAILSYAIIIKIPEAQFAQYLSCNFYSVRMGLTANSIELFYAPTQLLTDCISFGFVENLQKMVSQTEITTWFK